MERPLAPLDALKIPDSGKIVLYEDQTNIPNGTIGSFRNPKEFLQQATQLVKEEKYADALRLHDRALEYYRQHQHRESVVSWCSEATAWRNKGAIHRKLKEYRGAILAWNRAEELFRNCREKILAAIPQYGKSVGRYFPPEKQICIDSCIVDVLQSKANTHMKLDSQFREAINCHEDVIYLLLDIDRAGDHIPSQIPLDGVGFVRMDPTHNTEVLLSSLECLAELYTSTGAYEDGLAAFEEALQILRTRRIASRHNENVIHSMCKILTSLSELYFERNDLERAINTLNEIIDLRVSLGETEVSNCTRDALDLLDRAGQIAEDSGRLDCAIECYEKVLLTRNQFFGDEHIDVAKSLVNVGRVLELQGNTEGSLDLYRAAQLIYAARVSSKDFVFSSEDVETVLQLIPGLFEQGRYEEAVAYLNKCLESETSDEKKSETRGDRTQIYFTLGEAYIGMGDYVSATVCLVECAKQEGSVPEVEISMMLERVELLKRETLENGMSESMDANETEVPGLSSTSAQARARRAISEQLSFPKDETKEDPLMPGTPKVLDGARTVHAVEGVPNSTPSTVESSRTDSLLSDQMTFSDDIGSVKAMRFSKDINRREGEASRVVRGRPEKGGSGDLKHASSDLSSSFLSSDTSALDLSYFSTHFGKSASNAADFSPQKELADTDSLLRPSQTADSYDKWKAKALRFPSPRKRRGSVGRKSPDSGQKAMGKLGRGFRRAPRGFESLKEEKKMPLAPTVVLEREEEYHDDETNSTSEGPIKTFEIPSDSWDDISQITFVLSDGTETWERSNEWLWGVTAEGFGRWFPSQFVSQAVEVADGFLSARAIHSKVKSAPLDVISDDDSNDSRVEDKDHESNVGVAAKDKMSFAGMSLGEEAEIEPLSDSKNNVDLQAMILASSTSRRRNKGDDIEREIAEQSALLAKQRHDLMSHDPQIAATLFGLAVLRSRAGDFNGAIQSCTEALHLNQDIGNGHEVATNLHFLGDLHLHQRQYKSSLSFFMEALEIEQAVYGEYSEECAKTLNSIGAVRAMQNEFKLAMESHKEALRVLKECYGEDLRGNQIVSQTLCLIGAVYYRERNSLSTIKSKKDDYSTFVEAGMLEVIGRAHEERGSYKMAIAFFEEKLQFLENDSQEASSREDLATTLSSLGMLSSRAGLYMEALDYYERALAVQRTLGCDDIYLATAQVLKGTVKYQLGLWNEALQLFQSALTTLRRELGADHDTVAATLYHIGVAKSALCDYDTAVAALKDALQIQSTSLGQDHPAALRTRREIGIVFSVYPSEMNTAFDYFTKVLAGQQKIHGLKHPNIAETLHAIGCAYSRKGDFGSALKVLEECYYMRLEFLGVDHPLQATTLHEIAKIHVKRERFKKASRICDTVLDIRKESLGEGHIDYARALATKGSSIVGRGDFGSALKYATEALRICTEAMELGHPVIAEVNVVIGSIHLRNCQFPEAHASVDAAIAIYRESHVDEDFPGLQEALKLLERIERDEMLFV